MNQITVCDHLLSTCHPTLFTATTC